MGELLQDISILAIAYATFWYVLSLIFKRNDIADVAWGLGYALLSIYLYFTQATEGLTQLVYLLVVIWGLRLSFHIGIRNARKKEDFRYKQWREDWGSTFYWRSYLQVYILQVLLLLIISIPVVISSQNEVMEWSPWTYTGLSLWLVGFYWQAVGDYQLTQFKKTRKHKEEIIQTGLWKYSRHPNYFGEICMWWGIGIIVIPFEHGLIGLISPVLITYLLLKVSGVPMLERRYKGNTTFEAYKAKTPAVFPFLKP